MSRVFTRGGRSYCVCLICGEEFLYDLALMRMLAQERRKLGLWMQVRLWLADRLAA